MSALLVHERFSVRAPPAAVWAFLLDPRRVVSCVPGGELRALVDARTYDGAVRVAVGPLELAYAGRVRVAAQDPATRAVTIVGEARERAGPGSARLTLTSGLAGGEGGPTDVAAEIRLDLAGPIAELGRRVLGPLAHLVFQEFVSKVQGSIEDEEARRQAGLLAPAAPARSAPLRPVPLVLRALRAWLAGLLAARFRLRRR